MTIQRLLSFPLLKELLLMLGFLVVINNYIGNVDRYIGGDGVGYYEYLPSTFIRHDLIRNADEYVFDESTQAHFDNTGVYVDFEGGKVNKYPVGTALLQAPFFAVAHVFIDKSVNPTGYESAYQKSVFYAALFYLLLGLIFTNLLLKRYDVSEWTIFVVQTLLVFGTTLSHYTHFDAGYSHVYSFFAVTCFAYLAKSFFVTLKMRYVWLAAICFGLIFLLRNPNILILFFVPFLAGSWQRFKEAGIELWKNKFGLLVAVLAFFTVAGVQSLFWYLQTGHFLVYSYQGESFDFANPEVFNVLFSYRKGLFVYAPILLIGLLCTNYWIWTKRWFELATWWGFFALITFIISSWWTWVYGCSLGMRPYVDFYILFFVPLGIVLHQAKRIWKVLLVTICLLAIPVNLIQTYQYKVFILDWINMDATKYWNVFLKTEDKYQNIWAGEIVDDQYDWLCEFETNSTKVPKLESRLVGEWSAEELSDCEGFSVVRIKLEDEFSSHAIDKILVELIDSSGSLYWESRPIQHFAKQSFGTKHQGFFNFHLPEYDASSARLLVHAMNGFEEKKYPPMQVELLKGKWD